MKSLACIISIALCIVYLGSCDAAMNDKSTGISFADKANGLGIFGVGVRSKGPINIYSVGCYGSQSAKKSLGELSLSTEKKKALQALRTGAQNNPTTFILKFNYKVKAEKVSSSLTDAVASRFSDSNDVGKLKTMLCNGVGEKGPGRAQRCNLTAQTQASKSHWMARILDP
jgi:hypothetical protein